MTTFGRDYLNYLKEKTDAIRAQYPNCSDDAVLAAASSALICQALGDIENQIFGCGDRLDYLSTAANAIKACSEKLTPPK